MESLWIQMISRCQTQTSLRASGLRTWEVACSNRSSRSHRASRVSMSMSSRSFHPTIKTISIQMTMISIDIIYLTIHCDFEYTINYRIVNNVNRKSHYLPCSYRPRSSTPHSLHCPGISLNSTNLSSSS